MTLPLDKDLTLLNHLFSFHQNRNWLICQTSPRKNWWKINRINFNWFVEPVLLTLIILRLGFPLAGDQWESSIRAVGQSGSSIRAPDDRRHTAFIILEPGSALLTLNGRSEYCFIYAWKASLLDFNGQDWNVWAVLWLVIAQTFYTVLNCLWNVNI